MVILTLLLGIVTAHGSSLYRTRLDPVHAEEILARLVLKPRLSDQEWKDLLSAKLKSKRGLASSSGGVNQIHRVIANDNLWNVAKKYLGSPWYWPKIWATNSEIVNPHEIEIGRILAYYQESTQPTITIPLVKLVPAARGRSTTLESDSYLSLTVKNNYHAPVAILSETEQIQGEIRGSFTHRSILFVHEPIYVTPHDEIQFKKGDRLAVVRKERVLRDGGLLGGRSLGDLIRLLGEIEITRIDEDLAEAEVKLVLGTIQRGDLLVSSRKLFDLGSATELAPDDLQAKILGGEQPDAELMVQGESVLINRGTDDGMKPGYKFRIYRGKDPVTERESDVLPDYKGEVKIISTAKSASIGLILRNSEPILVGDLLLPAQRFPNRAPPPIRDVGVIEVN